jgi:cell division cycle protein 20 (cofactor of APC complex)
MMNLSLDVAEFENMMSLDNPIQSSTATRWERKARQQTSGSLASSNGASQSQSDRYIPHRGGMDFDLSNRSLLSCNGQIGDEADVSCATSEHAKLLLANTLDMSTSSLTDASKPARVLAFKNKAPAPAEGYQSSVRVLYSAQGAKKETAVKTMRHIPTAPVRVLDAPDMLDDYYLNLLSWGSNNMLAVALSQTVYLWNAASGEIQELMNVESNANDYISSVSWIQQGGSHLAIGTNDNVVQLWDVQAGRQVRTLRGHTGRIGALAWNQHMLSSGSKDTTVLNHDVRIQNHVVGRMTHHTQEVCGLAWSPDGSYLASGANDNTLCIMDQASMMSLDAQPKHVLTDHTAAVKALAWSPHERNLLASGGGTTDRCIKFWNASTGALVNNIDTGSQVCALQWSPFEKEILSSHGYAENQLSLWKYPSLARVKDLKGHTSRVLHMVTSPDGSMVCTGAADETLRFWNVFGAEGKKKTVGSVAGENALSNLASNGKTLKTQGSALRIR